MMKVFILTVLAVTAYSIEEINNCQFKSEDLFNGYLTCLDHGLNEDSNPVDFEIELLHDAM